MIKSTLRAACALGIITLSFPVHAQDAAPKGNVASGKTLYNTIGCWECHGTLGAGASTGPALTPHPNPIPWAAFSGEVRHPVNQMPPYSTVVLSDQELADIFAYTKTFPGPASRAEAGDLLSH